jgi:hypothetical protein
LESVWKKEIVEEVEAFSGNFMDEMLEGREQLLKIADDPALAVQ